MPTKLRRWTPPAASITLALVVLTGCTDAKPVPLPSLTSEPVFANEEEALAAVTETYEEYLRVSNTILIEGGADPERIKSIVGTQLAASEMESLGELAAEGKTLTGAPILISVQISEWYDGPDAAGVLATALACIDLSEVQVFDAAGISTVRPDRPRTRTWSIHVGAGQNQQSGLVLVARTPVAEGESCEE